MTTKMSLNNLYLLRILQIEVYLDILCGGIDISENYKLTKELNLIKFKLMEERKQIRRFLNMIELWKVK